MAATLLTVAAKSALRRPSPNPGVERHLPALRTNVSPAERWLSLAAGGALTVLGFDGRGPSVSSALTGGFLLYRAATGNCPAYQVLGIRSSGAAAPNTVIAAGQGARVEEAVTVQKPAAEVYDFLRDFENLPRFMTHLIDVDTTNNGRSHWIARGPLGARVEWDAELIADTPGEVISWRSLPGADVDTAGSVSFRQLPNDGGTEVRVALKYDPPAGAAGRAVAWLFGRSPARQIRADLQRFKRIVETGKVPAAETT